MCHVAGQPDEREPGRAHAGFHHRLHVYSGVGSFRHPILSGAHCLLFSSLARLLACSPPRLLASSPARLLACSAPRLCSPPRLLASAGRGISHCRHLPCITTAPIRSCRHLPCISRIWHVAALPFVLPFPTDHLLFLSLLPSFSFPSSFYQRFHRYLDYDFFEHQIHG